MDGLHVHGGHERYAYLHRCAPTLVPGGMAAGANQRRTAGRKGIAASKLGTTKYPGGVTQVTYNRHPLYYFRGPGADKKPGDARGQGFGKLWYVLSTKGTPIRK